ncbi:transmembrane protein, putative, partial [Bodo saltans]
WCLLTMKMKSIQQCTIDNVRVCCNVMHLENCLGILLHLLCCTYYPPLALYTLRLFMYPPFRRLRDYRVRSDSLLQ